MPRPQRGEGQWARNHFEPLNKNEQVKKDDDGLNVRERMHAHQEEPQCANCHRKIDPIGFGLENFDAAGKWRTEDSYERKGAGKKTWTINPAPTFHNGPAFKDYFELREILASKPEQLARGLFELFLMRPAVRRPRH